MKHLIKKILREETDMSNDSPFLQNQRAKMETGGNEIEDRVRVLMLQLSKIPQLDRFKNFYLFHGNPFGWGYGGQTGRAGMRKVGDTINAIPKLVGGDIKHFDSGQFSWLMVNTFFRNGGYQRDWKDRSEPLDLSPVVVYEVDANYIMGPYGVQFMMLIVKMKLENTFWKTLLSMKMNVKIKIRMITVI